MISALQQVLGPALIRSIVWHAQAPVVEYGRIRETFPGPCVRAAPSSLRAGHQPPPLKSGSVPEIVEAESIHIALLRELPPGLDPSCHWPVYIKFLILVFC